MVSEAPTRSVSTPVMVVGLVGLLALIAFGVFTVLQKKAPVAKPSILAERRAAASTESVESDPLETISWPEIALQSGRSPFVPGAPARADVTAQGPTDGPPAEMPEQPAPAEGNTGVPPVTLPGTSGAPPTLPGATGAPAGPTNQQPRGGPGTGGPPGLPVTPPTPGTMGPPPQQQQPAPQAPSRLDRTNAFFREFYPRSDESPVRPRRGGAGEIGGLTLAGTVIGSDGRPTGIVTDGETRRLVRPGQQWTVGGRTVTVVSVDRGRVVLRDERGDTIALQADGGATQ